jgi:hypothetical protein
MLGVFILRIVKLFAGILLLVGLSLVLTGCSGVTKMTTPPPSPTPPTTPTAPSQPSYPSTPPVQISWTPTSSLAPAPTADNPSTSAWGKGSNDFPLTVSSPAAGASVTSPFTVVASATPTNPIFFMRVYVDNVSVYYTSSNSINTQIFASPGQHTVLVEAESYACAALPCTTGDVSAAPISINVTSQSQATISDIQTLPGWQACSAKFPASSQRAGQLCAAGNTNVPNSAMTQGVASPSMDGKSAQFSMSAPSGNPDPTYGYSNYLYFNPVAGGNSVSNFTYDLYFYVDHPDRPQALEFDLNQGYDDTGAGLPERWTWGSECNFKGEQPAQWDIWDDANGVWKATGYPCGPFQPNTWNHLTWTFQRTGQQVFYDTLTVNGTSYPVKTTYNNQQGWTLEEIDTAFQMDLDSNADPYNVWLDQVSLTAN